MIAFFCFHILNLRVAQQISATVWHLSCIICRLNGSLSGVTYRKSDGGDVFLSGLHQKVHPEVHQLLLGCRLLHAGFLKLLVDQDGLHQRAQVPETNQRA